MADFFVNYEDYDPPQREDKSTNKEVPDPRPGEPGRVRYFRLIRFMSTPTFECTWRQLSSEEEKKLLPNGIIGIGPFQGQPEPEYQAWEQAAAGHGPGPAH